MVNIKATITIIENHILSITNSFLHKIIKAEPPPQTSPQNLQRNEEIRSLI